MSGSSPWLASGFEADDGRPDPDLLSALAAGDDVAMMRLLAGARLLTPVVPLPAGHDRADHHRADHHREHHDGRRHDKDPRPPHHDDHHHHDHDDDVKHAQPAMAAVSILAPDGRRAMLAFTGLPTLRDWDPSARPLPVAAPRLAGEALYDRFDVIILDRDSDHERVLNHSMLTALASGLAWHPIHLDPVIRQTVTAATQSEPLIRNVHLESELGRPGTLVMTLMIPPGIDPPEIEQLVTQVGSRLAADPHVTARLDDIDLRLRPDT